MREYDVLYTLSKCPEPIRLSELNRHVLLSQPALSRMVDRLAARGLVARQADPADGRGVRLSLTAGRAGAAAPDRPPARPRRGPGHDRGADAGRAPASWKRICRKLAASPRRHYAQTAGEDIP